MRSPLAVVAASFGLAVASAGCVVGEPETPTRGIAVSAPPPAPLPETPPPQPGPSAQWVAGYWHWTGMQYAWVPGHWEQGPQGATWAAPRYTTQNGRTFYESGRWQQPPANAGR